MLLLYSPTTFNYNASCTENIQSVTESTPASRTIAHFVSQTIELATNRVVNGTTTLIPTAQFLDVVYATYYGGLMATFTLLSLVANSFVVAATLLTPSLRTVSNYFIIALAVVEIFAAFTYTLYAFGSLRPPLLKYLGKLELIF